MSNKLTLLLNIHANSMILVRIHIFDHIHLFMNPLKLIVKKRMLPFECKTINTNGSAYLRVYDQWSESGGGGGTGVYAIAQW